MYFLVFLAEAGVGKLPRTFPGKGSLEDSKQWGSVNTVIDQLVSRERGTGESDVLLSRLQPFHLRLCYLKGPVEAGLRLSGQNRFFLCGT